MTAVPETFDRLVVKELSTDFRKACIIETIKTPALEEDEILVKNHYVGINATDVNFSAGRYSPGVAPPFPCGLEGLGEVVQKGSKVGFPIGQHVMYLTSGGAFGQYSVIKAAVCVPLPDMQKEYLALLLSGMTADLSLEKTGEIKSGETVVVTAAAGGTGQFAVQLAKLAGCHVIGTCSTESKSQMLKDLGCDRVVNYKEEDLGEVLSKEYPKGVDVVYETIGGKMFEDCFNNLGEKARLIVIGMITGYKTPPKQPDSSLAVPGRMTLLSKNASIRGFMLTGYKEDFKASATKLLGLYTAGKLKCKIDNGADAEKGPFIGLEGVYDGLDHLFSQKSSGKVVVKMSV